MPALVAPPSNSHPSARAFTLVEAMVAMAITAIILAGMGGVIVTLSRATEQGNDRNSRASLASSVVSEILDDLRMATRVVAAGETNVTVQVPDRDGDGAEETIAYSWNGTVGKPLERSYNGRAGYSLLNDVRGVSISLQQRRQPSTSTSAVRLLFDGSAPLSGSSGNTRTVGAGGGGAYAQYVVPNLPQHAAEWTPTSIRVRIAREGSANGVLLVQMLMAGPGGKPLPVVVAQSTVSESSLSAVPAWTTISFSSASPVPAGTSVFITFTSVNALLVLNPATPGLSVGAGGGLLGLGGDGGVLGDIGGALGSVLGSLAVSSIDTAYLVTASDPTHALTIRMYRSSDGQNWDPMSAHEQLLLELRGTVRTVTY